MALVDGGYALITGVQRRIGTIIPDVVIEEVTTDVLRVTDHPVEVGAAISDHAFMMPREIVMRCGWSDSSGGFEGYSATLLSMLIGLQAKREPFEVTTGKRYYKNMLITMINQHTNDETEHALVCTVGMREVILTSTQMGSAPAAAQSVPSVTAAPTATGLAPLTTNPSMPAFTQVNPPQVT